ncbi:hypothetical protein LMG27177_06637 [Paraburkholderia fynbosensis]|uniref:Uncharacterized protein n=1 Tax=Paraburkholderia fynbosensis TaxID=1200993 RepID=A0A6J5GXB4_9BURK|nr:hypothetical protein LMG27177_06637 [Paraburkholderia fynbosensis]
MSLSPANLRLVRGAGGILRRSADHFAHASETYAVMLEQILAWSGQMQKPRAGAHGVAFRETIGAEPVGLALPREGNGVQSMLTSTSFAASYAGVIAFLAVLSEASFEGGRPACVKAVCRDALPDRLWPLCQLADPCSRSAVRYRRLLALLLLTVVCTATRWAPSRGYYRSTTPPTICPDGGGTSHLKRTSQHPVRIVRKRGAVSTAQCRRMSGEGAPCPSVASGEAETAVGSAGKIRSFKGRSLEEELREGRARLGRFRHSDERSSRDSGASPGRVPCCRMN